MSGNKAGGKTTAKKLLARDPDHYRKIGSKGGKAGHTGGFYDNRELASIAGKKGGLASKRSKGRKQWKKNTTESKPVQITASSTGKDSEKTSTRHSLTSLMKRIAKRP